MAVGAVGATPPRISPSWRDITQKAPIIPNDPAAPAAARRPPHSLQQSYLAISATRIRNSATYMLLVHLGMSRRA